MKSLQVSSVLTSLFFLLTSQSATRAPRVLLQSQRGARCGKEQPGQQAIPLAHHRSLLMGDTCTSTVGMTKGAAKGFPFSHKAMAISTFQQLNASPGGSETPTSLNPLSMPWGGVRHGGSSSCPLQGWQKQRDEGCKQEQAVTHWAEPQPLCTQ